MAMTLRLPDELAEKLRALSETTGSSMQQLVTIAVNDYVTRNDKRRAIDGALDKILVDSADALRRLGEGA